MYDDDLIATDAISLAARRRAVEPEPEPPRRMVKPIRSEDGAILGFGDTAPQMEITARSNGLASEVMVGKTAFRIHRDEGGRMTRIEEQ